jgi:ribosomal protein S18 acetylase RimI-like enzyme
VDVPEKKSVKLLRNVSIFDKNISNLITETRDLSMEAFDEDCLEEVTKKSGWKLSLLVSEDLCTLCGFIVAKVTKGVLSIAKLAIRSEFRRHGFGRLIMEEVIKSARQLGDVYEVSLSSLAEAIKFYQRLGFKAFKNLKVDASRTDLVEGQVYMEKKLRPRPRK